MQRTNKRQLGLLMVLLIFCMTVGLTYVARPWAPPDAPPSDQADHMLVEKGQHTLTLFRNGHVLKIYRVSLGRGGPGQKLRAGDNKVPEGTYRIVGRNARSAFHRALKVGYPTPIQVAEAHAQGINPGGDIMVHGIRNGLGWIGPMHRSLDWTKGCVAVTDEEIEEIWRSVPDGTPIEIRP